MKMFFAVMLIVLLNVYAGDNVSLNFNKIVTDEQAINDTADIFIKEIEPFMEKPLEWCKVEPTGEFDLYESENEEVINLEVTAKMTCDETMAQKYFSSIAVRYQPYLLKNWRVVYERILIKYPDLSFGAIMMNHNYSVDLSYNHLYGGDALNSSFNKIKFFRMVLNDEHVSPDLKKFQVRGQLIQTYYNPGSFIETEKFRFRIYKKTIENGNVQVRFETVYHPSAEESKLAEKR